MLMIGYFELLPSWGEALSLLESALHGHCSTAIDTSRNCKQGWKAWGFACGVIDPNPHLWTMDEPLLIQVHCFLVYSEASFGSIDSQNLLPLETNHSGYLFSWSAPASLRFYLWFLVDFAQRTAWTQKCIRRQWFQVHSSQLQHRDCICTWLQAPCIQVCLRCH